MAFRSAAQPESFSGIEPTCTRRTFWQGAVVNILNPKTALFFLAFVPQLIDPAALSHTTQVAVLEAVFVVAGLVSDSIYAVLAGAAGDRFLRRDSWHRAQS